MPSLEPLLFDPDDLPRKPIDRSLTIRPPAKRPLSKEERAFNPAVAKVQALRARLDEEKRRLDRALVFEATELRPRLERVTAHRAGARLRAISRRSTPEAGAKEDATRDSQGTARRDRQPRSLSRRRFERVVRTVAWDRLCRGRAG